MPTAERGRQRAGVHAVPGEQRTRRQRHRQQAGDEGDGDVLLDVGHRRSAEPARPDQVAHRLMSPIAAAGPGSRPAPSPCRPRPRSGGPRGRQPRLRSRRTAGPACGRRRAACAAGRRAPGATARTRTSSMPSRRAMASACMRSSAVSRMTRMFSRCRLRTASTSSAPVSGMEPAAGVQQHRVRPAQQLDLLHAAEVETRLRGPVHRRAHRQRRHQPHRRRTGGDQRRQRAEQRISGLRLGPPDRPAGEAGRRHDHRQPQQAARQLVQRRNERRARQRLPRPARPRRRQDRHPLAAFQPVTQQQQRQHRARPAPATAARGPGVLVPVASRAGGAQVPITPWMKVAVRPAAISVKRSTRPCSTDCTARPK